MLLYNVNLWFICSIPYLLCILCADINTSRHVVNSRSVVTSVPLVAVYHCLDNFLHHHRLCLIQGYSQTHRRHHAQV